MAQLVITSLIVCLSAWLAARFHFVVLSIIIVLLADPPVRSSRLLHVASILLAFAVSLHVAIVSVAAISRCYHLCIIIIVFDRHLRRSVALTFTLFLAFALSLTLSIAEIGVALAISLSIAVVASLLVHVAESTFLFFLIVITLLIVDIVDIVRPPSG